MALVGGPSIGKPGWNKRIQVRQIVICANWCLAGLLMMGPIGHCATLDSRPAEKTEFLESRVTSQGWTEPPRSYR